MSRQEIDLYALLPSAYRVDDAAQGYPLQALMNILSEQANLVRQNIDELWDDFFIETCAEWVIPYIGDLVGNIPIYEAVRGRRGDVARTIYFRRRKGTLPMLEELARYVTGWSAHAVEFFQILGWTQNLNHLRPTVGTMDLRNLDTVDLVHSAFDPFSHTVDIRPTSFNQGWHSIKKIGFFIWRLDAYQLDQVMPRRSAQHDYGYHFSSLGHPQPLFNIAQSESDESGLAGEVHVNGPIRPTAFYYHMAEYYRQASGISIYLDRNDAANQPYLDESNLPDVGEEPDGPEDDPMRRVPVEKIVCKQLHDWQAPPDKMIAIDVARGRFAFGVAAGESAPDPAKVRVSYAYGFGGDIGGGPYDRTQQRQPDTIDRPGLLDGLELVSRSEHDTIQAALAVWDTTTTERLVIEIGDSRTYSGDLDLNRPPGSPLGKTLVIQARNEARPTFSGRILLGERSPATVILDGLLIEGHIEVAAESKTATLSLYHCTLVPGRTLDEAGLPRSPLAPSILVAEPNLNLSLSLYQCITGPVRAPDSPVALAATDCILHAPGEAEARLLPALISGNLPAALGLTSPTPAIHLRFGNDERRVTLSPPFTTPEEARTALEAAIRAATPEMIETLEQAIPLEQEAFAQARVALVDARLVVMPGSVASIQASAVEGDGTLDELHLNVESADATIRAYAAYGLWGAARPGDFAARVRKLRLTMETDEILSGQDETELITVAESATDPQSLAQVAADLQAAIHLVGGPAFASALVAILDDALLLLPGVGSVTPLVAAAEEDALSASELGLVTARPVLAGNAAGTQSGPPLTLENATVFGKIYVKELTLGSNTIFTEAIRSERRQAGCVRFSYVADGSRTPRRYRCQPDTALEALAEDDVLGQERTRARLAPTFSTRLYGQPAYAQLGPHTAVEIGTGADNGAEMGVFNRRMQPQRLANLRTRLGEYLPFGLEAAIIFVT